MPPHALTWDLSAIPAVIIGGTALHFGWQLLGRRRVVAVVCPVNESVWEHLKMAYWPVLAVTLIQLVAGSGTAELVGARAIGAVTMCALIIGLYYITAALLPHMSMRARLSVDGTVFVVAVIARQLMCHLLLAPLSGLPAAVAALLMALPALVLTITTFAPPQTALFEDQVRGGYGPV